MPVPLEFAVERTSHPAADEKRAAVLADPGFGRYYTDHMVSLLYSRELG